MSSDRVKVGSGTGFFGFTFLVVCVLASPLMAQVDTGTISGIVRDAQGAVVPGAEIVATNVNTNAAFETISDETGLYRVSALPIGRYSVSASLTGFKTAVRPGVILRVQDVLRVDFRLDVGEISDQVTVTGEAPLLETETSSVGQVIDKRTILDLPLNGRNYLQLAKLSAGVIDPPPNDRAAVNGSFVAGGMRASLNMFLLDGVDNNARDPGVQNESYIVMQPSIDAIEEFKVQTHNFSAEFGHAAGAVVNARIKSGSNELHGSIYEFHRNDDLDARHFFAPAGEAKPKLSRHQFGGTVGGPIVPDQAFFFFSYEGGREGRGFTRVLTLPSAAMRRGDFSGDRPLFDPDRVRPNSEGKGFIRDPFPGNVIPAERIDPISRRVADLIPLPNLPGSINNFVVSPLRSDDSDQFNVRIDHIFSDTDTIFGRYGLIDRTAEGPVPLPDPLFGSAAFTQEGKEQRAHAAAIGWTRTFNPTVVNDARLGYNRINDQLISLAGERLIEEFGFKGIPPDPVIGGLPRMNISNFANLGSFTFIPSQGISETVDVRDDLSFNRGEHSFKVGFNYRWLRRMNLSAELGRGSFDFNGVFTQDPQNRAGTGSAFADFLLGYASDASLSTPLPDDLRNHMWGFYCHDDWKVSPGLTVNLGLRYEFRTPTIERHDRQGNFLLVERKLIYPNNARPAAIPTDVVIDVPDGLHSRGLMRFDKNNFAPRIGLAYQLTPSTVIRAGGGIFYSDVHPSGQPGQLVGSPPFRVGVSFPSDQITPVITFRDGFPEGSLVLDPADFDASNTRFIRWSTDFPIPYAAQWNLNIQRQFPGEFLLDVGYTGTKGTQFPIEIDFNQPLPGAGSTRSRRPIQGFGQITGDQSFNNTHYHALQVRAERRYTKDFSFLVSYTWSKTIEVGGEDLIGDNDFRDIRNLSWERSLAIFDMRNRVSIAYIWELPWGTNKRWDLGSSVLNAVLGNWQINGITTLQSGQPVTPSLGFSSANTGSRRPNRLGDGNLPASQRTLARYFDVAAFAPAEPFNFGNAGQFVIIGPGAVNFDFSLFKRIPVAVLGEQGEVQFRAEFFNFLNTPQFGLPNSRVDIKQGGSITSLANNMREIQFGLKILF